MVSSPRTATVALHDSEDPTLELVGGKSASLMRLADAGYDVPPGRVLTTAFFASWTAAIVASSEWLALRSSYGGAARESCDALETSALTLPLARSREEALAEVPRALGADRPAVRSSSPEEDRVTASFAGLYDTVSDVRPAEPEGAARTCFASALDIRVPSDERQHGTNVGEPRIAVVVKARLDGGAGTARRRDQTVALPRTAARASRLPPLEIGAPVSRERSSGGPSSSAP